MAFPVVQSRTTTTANNTTSIDANYEAGSSSISAGDLLLYFVSRTGSTGPSMSTPSGLTLIGGGPHVQLGNITGVYKKSAAGTEGGGTQTFSTNNSGYWAVTILRITGHSGVSDVEVSFLDDGIASTGDPPNLTVSWGSDDNLWVLGLAVSDEGELVTSWPTNYSTNGANNANTAGGVNNSVNMATSWRTNAAASENPGSFTVADVERVFDYVIGVKPAAAAGVSITVPQANLTLSTTAPTVQATANVSIAVPSANLALSTTAPTVVSAANVAIEIPQANLALSTQAPTVARTANVAVEVPQANLALTTFAPTVAVNANVDITVPAADLTLSTQAPAVARTANVSVTVPSADLALSTEAPTVGINWSIVVPQGDLSLSTVAPSVRLGINIFVPSADLTLTTTAPTVATTADVTIEIPQGNLLLTGFAPSVVATGVDIWTPIAEVSTTWTEITAASTTWTEI